MSNESDNTIIAPTFQAEQTENIASVAGSTDSPRPGQEVDMPPTPPVISQSNETPIALPPPPPATSKPALLIPQQIQSSNSTPRARSIESRSPSSNSPSLSPRVTPRTIDTTAAQASTDKAREAIAALQRSLQGGKSDLEPKALPVSRPKPDVPHELSGTVAQHLFAQINEHFEEESDEGSVE